MAAGSEAGPRSLDRRSPLPLWAQLAGDLERRLSLGAFVQAFPSEHELVSGYGVSRHTVREALRRLRDDGLLDSARGQGTWVRKPQIDQPLGAMYSLHREVQARGIDQTSTVHVLDVRRDERVAEHLQVTPDSDLVYLERLRLADGVPLALDHAWLPRSEAEPILNADFSHSALYDQLAELAGIRLTGGEERIHAVVPTSEQRRVLALRRGVAAFAIERLGCVRDRPVEWRETLVRADRFSLLAQWSHRGGYRLDVAG